jgi:hypothetical protein
MFLFVNMLCPSFFTIEGHYTQSIKNLIICNLSCCHCFIEVIIVQVLSYYYGDFESSYDLQSLCDTLGDTQP